jgi:UDP-N-acetylmuramoyl-L-alanyl-D-glutamate--2,6-diaminopimelate ligase
MFRKLKNLIHWFWGWYWVIRCGYPARDLPVIGVTGTDGKTTTCTLIYEILKAAGIKTGLVTTVGAYIGDDEIDTGLHVTNPGPELLQPLLVKMKKAGITHVVLEVTSHGLDQNRVVGCNFKIGVLTNITHEHLDYHKTMVEYREAKAKLFRSTHFAVLNKDDNSFEYFSRKRKSKCKIVPYSKSNVKDISPALFGDYNLYNIGAATAVAEIFKIQDTITKQVIKLFEGVKGRREVIKMGQKFRVIVDFAHTPNALEQMLKSLKTQKTRKLIVVFGCTGERDKEKRPMMGEIATRLADVVIITSDDTRSESQDEIYKQIISGINPKFIYTTSFPPPNLGGGIKKGGIVVGKVFKENDRRKAIEMAIKMAKPGDVVLLAGKGHEKTILRGKTEIPWSDQETAREILGMVK